MADLLDIGLLLVVCFSPALLAIWLWWPTEDRDG